MKPHHPQPSINALERRAIDEVHTFSAEMQRNVFHQATGIAKSQAMPLLEWGRYYLPRHFHRPASRLHRWLAEQLERLQRQRGGKINLVGPRGAAKSTVATLAYVLRMALEKREPYIWIVSDTKLQAQTHLENLKTELTENNLLLRHFPRETGESPHWRATSVRLNNGVVIESYGTGQRIRGRRRQEHRPTLIVCDDLENDRHMLSPERRQASRNWFHGTLLKAGTRSTNVVNLATALHRDALAMQLDRTPGWNSALFRAIERWPQNLERWAEWERIYANVTNPTARRDAWNFFQRHRRAMEAGAVLLWPEEEDLYTLMKMRVEGGRTAFEREKQSSPIDPERCEWPEEYFAEHIWFDRWPNELLIRTVALDPSKGSDARQGDYSAYVVLGISASGMLYVEADLARRPTPQMVADGVELCREHVPDFFGVEANQYQELLAGEFAAEFTRQAVRQNPPYAIHNHVNKQVRIRRLGPYLSQRRLRFLQTSASTRLLVDQLRDFPQGGHDDGPDALEMALRLAEELFHGHGAGDGLGNRLPVET